MNEREKLQLKRMIQENNVEDQTDQIRNLKHSSLIRKDVAMLEMLKHKHKEIMVTNNEQFQKICIEKCSFLFNNYMDIFNKIIEDQLDLTIFNQFIDVLSRIENEELDQHEGSYEIGKLLKKLYVDTALRESESLNYRDASQHVVNNNKKSININWKEYKTMSLRDNK